MLINDNLVEYITKEILKKLQESNSLKTPSFDLSSQIEKPPLRIVGDRNKLSTLTLNALSQVYSISDHTGWDTPVTKATYLLTNLGIQPLVRVSEGDEGCTVEGRVLMASILNGYPVWAIEEGLIWRRYLSTAPKTLINRYIQHEKNLLGYGLQIVPEEKLACAILNRNMTPSFQENEKIVFKNSSVNHDNKAPAAKKIMTEADIKMLCPEKNGSNQKLMLSKGVILTPLAHDYINSLKIELIFD